MELAIDIEAHLLAGPAPVGGIGRYFDYSAAVISGSLTGGGARLGASLSSSICASFSRGASGRVSRTTGNPKAAPYVAIAAPPFPDEVPTGDYQLLGFLDVDANADPADPSPDADDPVFIPIGGFSLSCAVQPVTAEFALLLPASEADR